MRGAGEVDAIEAREGLYNEESQVGHASAPDGYVDFDNRPVTCVEEIPGWVVGSSKGDEELQSDDGHYTNEGTDKEHQGNSHFPLPLHLKAQ